MTRSRFVVLQLAALLAFSVFATACDDAEDASITDSGSGASTDAADLGDADSPDTESPDAEAPDTGEADDTADLSDADGSETTVVTPCGPDLDCTDGQVCVIECLCCGIDTGNPDDVATDYSCVSPPEDCDDTPAACVAAESPCYPSSDLVCESPCA